MEILQADCHCLRHDLGHRDRLLFSAPFEVLRDKLESASAGVVPMKFAHPAKVSLECGWANGHRDAVPRFGMGVCGEEFRC